MKALSEIARAPFPGPRRPRATTRGIITLVQEGRFQLEDPDGVRRLFILAHDAPLEPADLQALLAAGTLIRVEYGDAEGLVAAVAYDVAPLGS